MTGAQGKLAELGSSAAGERVLYLACCRLTLVQTSQISPREGIEGVGMMSARDPILLGDARLVEQGHSAFCLLMVAEETALCC